MNNIALGRLYELQIEARNKGLLILCGKKDSFLHACSVLGEPVELINDEIGYAVVKRYGGIDFAVEIDGTLLYEVYYDGPFENWTV